jgi:hypothetical protein
VLFSLRRVYRSYKGTRFSMGRTIGFVVVYVAIGAVFSTLSFFEGVSLLFAAPYVAVLIAALIFSYRFTDRRISFWKGGDGSVYFKGGVVLYIIYIVGLIARLSIDVAVFGNNLFVVNPSVVLTGTDLYATIGTDLLLMFGLGLLIGRNARVFKRYQMIERGKEPLPDSPPVYESIFGSPKPSTAPSTAVDAKGTPSKLDFPTNAF